MNDRAVIFTIMGTKSVSEKRITRAIKGNRTMILQNVSVYIVPGIDGADKITPKVINLQVGNTVDTFYLVDSTDGQNTLELVNQYNPVTINTVVTNVSEYQANVGYYFSGDIDNNITVRVLDENYKVMDGSVSGGITSPDLKSYFFQFQMV